MAEEWTSDLVGFFWNYMDRKYLERVLRSLFDCYAAADERCQTDFEKSEAANVRPFYRRGLIEGQLRDLAGEFPTLSATARRSPASSWHHTLVISDRVAFTQNALGDPDGLVRPSLFRHMYAANDNQRFLFPELEPEAPPPDSVLYGILVHGQSDESATFPGFAKIVFPKDDLKSYWPGNVDLFAEFPEVVRSKTEGLFEVQTGVEEIAAPQPELRVEQKKIGTSS